MSDNSLTLISYHVHFILVWSITFCFSFPSYVDFSTYNADFDGDEINVHFPQDENSRAEAYNIVNANNQYVKPTSGDPIRALIQVFAILHT